MTAGPEDYAPLTSETLGPRLGQRPELASRLGRDTSLWTVREVGDGNLNLVFIVESPTGAVVVKQALPYVRLVGDSWPLPLKRSFFEYHALRRQDQRCPGLVPEIYHFDEAQAMIVMEYLSPHHILRHSLIAGERHAGLGKTLGHFCAETLFRGSDLHLPAPERKADLALFAGNVELCDITENLVFTDPYFDAEMNHHVSPQLDAVVAELRADLDLKVQVQHLKAAFCNHSETLLHGDLHTGSVMVHGSDVKVIDPEFALYGPIGLDLGMLLGNYFMAWFAQPGHATDTDDRHAYRDWIAAVVQETWRSFEVRFRELWRYERHGILYPHTLYEDQGHAEAADQALAERLAMIWRDTLGFAGAEIHRRILGLAHIIEYESIENPDLRAHLQAQGLRFGRQLVVNRAHLRDMPAVIDLLARCGQADNEYEGAETGTAASEHRAVSRSTPEAPI